jgi:hypothetical protein
LIRYSVGRSKNCLSYASMIITLCLSCIYSVTFVIISRHMRPKSVQWMLLQCYAKSWRNIGQNITFTSSHSSRHYVPMAGSVLGTMFVLLSFKVTWWFVCLLLRTTLVVERKEKETCWLLKWMYVSWKGLGLYHVFLRYIYLESGLKSLVLQVLKCFSEQAQRVLVLVTYDVVNETRFCKCPCIDVSWNKLAYSAW